MDKREKFDLDFKAALEANPAFRKAFEDSPVIKNLAFTVWDKGIKRTNKENGNGVHKKFHVDTSSRS